MYKTKEERVIYNEYIKRRRRLLKERGLCIFCRKKVMNKVVCIPCQNRLYQQRKKRGDQKKYYIKNRKRLNAYNLKRMRKKLFGGLYDFILSRDHYQCQTCGTNKKLCIHHKDGNGSNSKNPKNTSENLITLCRSCHAFLHRSQQIFIRHIGKIVRCKICEKPKKLYNVRKGMCRNCYGVHRGHFIRKKHPSNHFNKKIV